MDNTQSQEFEQVLSQEEPEERRKVRRCFRFVMNSGPSLIFFIILSVVLFGSHNYNSYLLTNSLRRNFIESKFFGGIAVPISFQQIQSIPDFWQYLEKLPDLLYWKDFYYKTDSNRTTITKEDKHIFTDNLLFEQPRIRMLQVRGDSCKVEKDFRQFTRACYVAYSRDAENRSEIQGKYLSMKYTFEESFLRLVYPGEFTTYGTGGYIIKLPNQSYNKTKTIIRYLREEPNFLTRATRVIFIEFSIYNIHVDQMAMVKLIFEFPPSGGVYPSYQIISMDIYRKIGGYVFSFKVMFTVWASIYLMYNAWYFVKDHRKYCSSFINIMSGLKALMAFIATVFIIINFVTYKYHTINLINITQLNTRETSLYLENFYHNENVCKKFMIIEYFVTVFDIFRHILSIEYFKLMNQVFRRFIWDITYFTIFFGVAFLGCAIVGYLLLNFQVYTFRSLLQSVNSCFLIVTGRYNYTEFTNLHFEKVLLLLGLVFLFLIVINVFTAIIYNAYVSSNPEQILDQTGSCSRIEKCYESLTNKCCKAKPKHSFVPRDINILQLKNALLSYGFTQQEINQYFETYGIESSGYTSLTGEELFKRLEQIGDLNHWPLNSGKFEINKEGSLKGPIDINSERLLERIRRVEELIGEYKEYIEEIKEVI